MEIGEGREDMEMVDNDEDNLPFDQMGTSDSVETQHRPQPPQPLPVF